jgi:uncharacterized protein (DUF924 family)
MAHWAWTDLITHWFGESLESPAGIASRQGWWFGADDARDERLAERYGALVGQCAAGHLNRWLEHPEGRLALIIALDQLPRNLFRGTPRAYAHDAQAAAWCLAAVHTGQDLALKPVQRVFLYMPLQHQEDLQAQEVSLQLYSRLAHENPDWPVFEQEFLRFARVHRDIIARFGRFPHRNRVLGRPDTTDEERYLAGDPPRFGQ